MNNNIKNQTTNNKISNLQGGSSEGHNELQNKMYMQYTGQGFTPSVASKMSMDFQSNNRAENQMYLKYVNEGFSSNVAHKMASDFGNRNSLNVEANVNKIKTIKYDPEAPSGSNPVKQETMTSTTMSTHKLSAKKPVKRLKNRPRGAQGRSHFYHANNGQGFMPTKSQRKSYRRRYRNLLEEGYVPNKARKIAAKRGGNPWLINVPLPSEIGQKSSSKIQAPTGASRPKIDSNKSTNLQVIKKIAVLPKTYPMQMLSMQELNTIEDALVKEITQGWCAKLMFDDITYQPGLIIVTCVGQETIEWLNIVAPKLNALQGVELTTCPEQDLAKAHLISIMLPKSGGKHLGELLALIDAQNMGLTIQNWTVHECEDQGDQKRITVGIDDTTLTTLKDTGLRINFRFGYVRVHYIERCDLHKISGEPIILDNDENCDQNEAECSVVITESPVPFVDLDSDNDMTMIDEEMDNELESVERNTTAKNNVNYFSEHSNDSVMLAEHQPDFVIDLELDSKSNGTDELENSVGSSIVSICSETQLPNGHDLPSETQTETTVPYVSSERSALSPEQNTNAEPSNSFSCSEKSLSADHNGYTATVSDTTDSGAIETTADVVNSFKVEVKISNNLLRKQPENLQTANLAAATEDDYS